MRESDICPTGKRAGQDTLREESSAGKLMKMVMSQEVTRKKQAEHCRKEAAHAGKQLEIQIIL